MKKNKITAVIPAYNEENTISKIVKKTKNYVDEVIVVDDGSMDNTCKEAKKSGAFVIKHIINLGKGNALKTGCEAALIRKADKIIFLDADGQHDPSEIPSFINKLRDYDIVFGSRINKLKMPLSSRLGNVLLPLLTTLLFKIRISDTQSGYRAFSLKAYKKIKWITSGYAVENEIIARVGKNKLNYVEIPIRTIYNHNYKGTTFLDGFKILLSMIIWRLTWY